MTKVAIVVPTLGTGGGEKLAYELATRIDKSRFCVSVICLHPQLNNPREDALRATGVELVFLNKKQGLDLGAFLSLGTQLKRIRPDVIHSHLDVLLYLLPFYRRDQIKLHTVHSMAQYEATGLQRVVRWLAFRLLGVTPVAIGDSVRNSICSCYGLTPHRIPVVYNGVAMDGAKDREKHQTNMLSLISIGTLYPIKNHRMQLLALQKILQQGVPARLTILGDGPLKEELTRQIRDMGLTHAVTLAGWQEQVGEYLKKADIYLCTSTVEGISLAILEAMAWGLPVIATDVGGNKDLVHPGENGILIPSGDADALADAIGALFEDEMRREAMAQASSRIAGRFDILGCVSEYEKLYANIDSQNHRRRG